MIGRCNTRIAEEEEARVALRSSEGVAEEVIRVSVRAKTSMLRVSARSEIAVFERVEKRANVKCTCIESEGSRPRRITNEEAL